MSLPDKERKTRHFIEECVTYINLGMAQVLTEAIYDLADLWDVDKDELIEQCINYKKTNGEDRWKLK